MKPLIGLVVLLFTTGAFAQTAPPKPVKGRRFRSSRKRRRVANSLERSRGRSFGRETARTPRNLEAPHPRPKPARHPCLTLPQAPFRPVKNNRLARMRPKGNEASSTFERFEARSLSRSAWVSPYHTPA